jgi:hypothetical protein
VVAQRVVLKWFLVFLMLWHWFCNISEHRQWT